MRLPMLNDEAADQRRIDLHVEVDLGLGDVAERRLDLAEHPLGGLLGERAPRRWTMPFDLATRARKAADHVGQREQPPVRRDEADEVAGRARRCRPVRGSP